MKKSVFMVRMTPPLLMSNAASCWNQEMSRQKERKFGMLHILIRIISNKLADFLVMHVISSSQHMLSDYTLSFTPR